MHASVLAASLGDVLLKEQSPSGPSDKSPSREGACVLLVDDLPEKLLVLETILEDLDAVLVKANSGREALRRVLEHDFAVILLDVNMPGMDGLETAELIRKRRQCAHTPIIFVTAYPDDMHTAKGYSLGAVDYICTPILPEILRTKVGVFIDLYRKTQQIQRQADERVALAREQVLRLAAEENSRRSSFRARASAAIGESLDYNATIRNSIKTLIPFLGRQSAIVMYDDFARPETVAWARQEESAEVLVDDCRTLNDIPRLLLDALAEAHEEERLTTRSAPLDAFGATPATSREPWAAMATCLTIHGRRIGAIACARSAPDGEFDGVDQLLFEEIARRAAIAVENCRLYRNLDETHRRKDEFLAMLSHELRNPLAAICNALQVLDRIEATTSEFHWGHELIERQTMQLVRLVDDLLDVSRITMGKIDLRLEVVDLRTIAACAVETSQPLIDTRAHRLEAFLPPEPLLVEADSARMVQAVANLLNNAAKYTPPGGSITLELFRDGADAALSVRDSGVGINPSMLELVFDLFAQGERSLDRSQGGLGVGLTLVRKLVELHGGVVMARSEGLNRGSEFIVRLPALSSGSMDVNFDPKSPSDHEVVESKRVLVVDDNVDAANSMRLCLKLLGHDVYVCHDGVSAMDQVKAIKPHVVLLDIGLPGMDGYEVAAMICQSPLEPRPLLVAVSGYAPDGLSHREESKLFARHLVKPVDLNQVEQILNEAAPVRS